MAFENLALLSRRDRLRLGVLVGILVAVVIWASLQFAQPGPPRRIVLATGAESGVYHKFGRRYIELLRQHGVSVEERMTGGAAENLRLLLDPRSGVDVAFMQGGIAGPSADDDLVMLASLYYEPLWVFYRDATTLTKVNQLRGKRIAVGAAGSGTRVLVERILVDNGLLTKNGVARDNTELASLGGDEALAALQAGSIDAALFVGGALTPAVQSAMRDRAIKLMSLADAAAYPRRFPYITKLTLPSGTIDPGLNVPERDVDLIGTKAMLAARESFHPALVNLLVDAAKDVHGGQGYFEAAGEFPGTAPVDLQVSPYADQHKRFGPSILYRYLPFWVAGFIERAIIVLIPLVVILVPVAGFLPDFLRWRTRSRIYRWYGELALLERDVKTRTGTLPVEQWLADLDRIENSVAQIHTPPGFASEAYTLREHIGFVRREVASKVGGAAAAGA